MTAAARGIRAGSDPAARATSPATDADPLPGLVSGLSRQNSAYRRMMAACDKLAGAAVQGADAAELARIFAETAGKTVILLDPELRPQAQAASTGTVRDWDPGDASLAKLLRLLTAERRPLRVPPVPGSALVCGCLATPVLVGDTILGYLLVLDETANTADDVDLIVASYAATLFALTLARTKTTLELGLRYRSAIVDSLVSGHFLDSQDARRKARILGVGDAQPFRIAVARISAPATPQPGPGEQVHAEELLTRLAGSIHGAATIRGPELVILLPEQDGDDTPTRNAGASAGSPEAGIQPLLRQAGAGHTDVRAQRADPAARGGAAGPAAGSARHRPGHPPRPRRADHLLREPRHLPAAATGGRHAPAAAVRRGRTGPASRLRRPAQGRPRSEPCPST